MAIYCFNENQLRRVANQITGLAFPWYFDPSQVDTAAQPGFGRQFAPPARDEGAGRIRWEVVDVATELVKWQQRQIPKNFRPQLVSQEGTAFWLASRPASETS